MVLSLGLNSVGTPENKLPVLASGNAAALPRDLGGGPARQGGPQGVSGLRGFISTTIDDINPALPIIRNIP